MNQFADALRSVLPAADAAWEPWALRRAEASAAVAARHLRPHQHALDLSSGPHFAYLLSRATPDVRWSHTDFDCLKIQFTDRHSGKPVFDYSPMHFELRPERQTLPGGPYDAVTCWEVVEHLAFSPGWLFGSVSDALAVDRQFLFSTPNVGGLSPILRQLRGSSPLQLPYFPQAPWHHVREYGVWELRQLLRWAGFEAVELVTRDVYQRDARGWRAWVHRAGLLLAAVLCADPAEIRHVLWHSGSTQFWVCRKARPCEWEAAMPSV
jgi:hypothetical protein